MSLLRRVCSVGAATGLLVAAGMSGAFAAPPVDSDLFAYDEARCEGTYWYSEPRFVTHADFGATSDADNDVNVGDPVDVSLILGHYPLSFTAPTVEVGFEIDGVPHVVSQTSVLINEAVPTTLGTHSFVVGQASAGTVIDIATKYLIATDQVFRRSTCTTSEGEGIVGLYVNRPPELADDSASTLFDTAVTVDVLANDDATNDTGTITSNNPTADELATQDNDPVALPSQVAIATDAANGECVIEADGRVTYTPDDGFYGTDECTYSVTDNDGATSTATLEITVAEKVDQPVDEPDDENIPPVDDGEGDSDDEAIDVIEPVGNVDQTLPNGGGPALSLLWLGAGLAGAGTVAVAASRSRRFGKSQA